MKSNFRKIFSGIADELKDANDVNIDEVLNKIMPQIRFSGHPSRSEMAREIMRGRLTTALNKNHIYSYKKGHFVYIENADEQQLTQFMRKADRDIRAAEQRKANAEMLKAQMSMAWDENGDFIGFVIPEAITI